MSLASGTCRLATGSAMSLADVTSRHDNQVQLWRWYLEYIATVTEPAI